MADATKGLMHGQRRRVTIRDIAARVGMHFTTVAEALRDSPRVKKETKERIVETAKEMGYRFDPLLSALLAYRASQRKPVYQGTLAWINGFEERDHFSKGAGFYQDCFEGAAERSKALGYELEPFWVSEPNMNATRATQILHSRNTAGVIVGPMPQGLDELNILWERFCTVRIGYSLKNAQLPTLISDQFGNMKLLYNRLAELGFRRIGFACPKDLDNRVNNHWSGAFLAMQRREHADWAVPPFLDQRMHGSPRKFMKWYREYQPEVIITGGARNYFNFLSDAGVAVPEKVQVVSIHTDGRAKDLCGIVQNGTKVGSVAVDHLVATIHREAVGIETYAKTVMVKGSWKDGSSFNASLAPVAET